MTFSRVLAALRKYEAEHPDSYLKLKILLDAPSLAYNMPTTGGLLPGNDNRTVMGNVGRFLAFLQEVCPWFVNELDVRQEIESRSTDTSPDWPGYCLALFTWDAIAPKMASGKESVTFILRPEFALAHHEMKRSEALQPEPCAV